VVQRRAEHKDESDWWLYSRSKIYNIMTCKELARRLEVTGITSLVAHPGLSVTDHFGKSDSENKLSSKLIETYANSPIGQSAEGGAIPLEFACTAEELEGMCFGCCSRDSAFQAHTHVHIHMRQSSSPNHLVLFIDGIIFHFADADGGFLRALAICHACEASCVTTQCQSCVSNPKLCM